MGPPGCWRWLRDPSSPLFPPPCTRQDRAHPISAQTPPLAEQLLHSGGASPTLKGATTDDPWNKKEFCEPVAHQRGLHQLGDACNTVMQTEQRTKDSTSTCPLLVALEPLPGLKPTPEVTGTGTGVTHSSDSCDCPPPAPPALLQLGEPLMLQLPLMSRAETTRCEGNLHPVPDP